MTKEAVLEVLGTIMDPDMKKDIVSLNFVEELIVENEKIMLTVYSSNPALHARKRVQEAIEFNLKRVFGEATTVVCMIKGLSQE